MALGGEVVDLVRFNFTKQSHEAVAVSKVTVMQMQRRRFTEDEMLNPFSAEGARAASQAMNLIAFSN
jgi:hypothetical protein